MLNRTLQVPLTLIDCDGWPLMTPGPSDEVDIECSHGRRSHEEDDNLPSLNELLLGAGGAQESHRAQPRDKHGMGGSDTQNDCNHVPIPGPNVETRVGISTAAAASTSAATTQLVRSRVGGTTLSVLHRLWQAQKLGTILDIPAR